MQPDNMDQLQQAPQQKQYNVEEFLTMQQLGRQMVDLYHKFSEEKGKDVPWDLFLGAVDYVIKLHRGRATELLGSFIKLESAAQHEGLIIPEPYSDNINAQKNTILL